MTDFKTSDRDVNRAIRSWLHEDRHEDVSRIAGAVLDQVDTIPQRRATWWPARRTSIMSKFVTIGLGAAALVVALFVVGAQLFGTPSGGAGPEATPTPTRTARPSPSIYGVLPEGPHILLEETDRIVPVTVTIRAPVWDGSPGQGGICWAGPDEKCGRYPDNAHMRVFQGREYYVYEDVCDWSNSRPDTPATTVDELVDALANQAFREASAPEDIIVGGYPGKRIILSLTVNPEREACDVNGIFDGSSLFAGESYSEYYLGPEGIEEVWAFDVDGTLVVLWGSYYADTTPSIVDELHATMTSTIFETP